MEDFVAKKLSARGKVGDKNQLVGCFLGDAYMALFAANSGQISDKF
jgi:hypothetical protein